MEAPMMTLEACAEAELDDHRALDRYFEHHPHERPGRTSLAGWQRWYFRLHGIRMRQRRTAADRRTP
jgi:hypothetical protein